MALLITFPFARSDAVIYDFRVTWHGRDLVSAKARFRDDEAKRTEAEPFSAWDHEKNYLVPCFEKAASGSDGADWESIDPFTTIIITPGLESVWHFRVPDAHTDAPTPGVQTERDAFTVYLRLDPDHHLRYQGEAGRGGELIFSFYTNRKALSEFARQLRAEHEDCQANRKQDPSDDDTLWRMLH